MDRRYDNKVEHYNSLLKAKLNGDAVQILKKQPIGFHPNQNNPQDTDFEHKKNEVATKVKVAKILIDIFRSAEKEDGINRRHF